MYLRGKYWHYDFYINKKRFRGSTGFIKNEKAKAARMVAVLKSGLRDEMSGQIIITVLKSQHCRQNNSPVEHENIWKKFIYSCNIKAGLHRRKIYSSRLRDFCIFMKERFPEVQNINEVQNVHAKTYRNHLETLCISNSTRNDHISGLKLIFSHLASIGEMKTNPFAEVKKFPLSKIKREAFSTGELEKIFSCSSGWMHHLFLLTLCTGLRKGDAALLKRGEIDETLSWITIEKTRKTGAKVDIPIFPFLRQHLKTLVHTKSPHDYIHPELAQMYLTNAKGMSREIKKFFCSIGLSDTTRKISGYKNKVSVKDIHSFRHTFIYHAAVSNIPLPVIRSVVGHTTEEMTSYYTEHAARKEKEAILKIFPETGFTAKLPTIAQLEEKKSSL